MERLDGWPNLAAMMLACARSGGRRSLFRFHRDDAWHSLDWAGFGRAAGSVARALRRLGVSAGERVLLVSENRPEVAIAEVALMAIRAVPVPAYATNTAADHAHLLRDCGARAAIVSSQALERVVRQAAGLAGGLDLLVRFDAGPDLDPARGPAEGSGSGVGASPDGPAAGAPAALPWPALEGDGLGFDDIAAEAALIAPGAMACLLYTSGTGGPPKGVMLPHRAILANLRSLARVVRDAVPRPGRYLSFLPASHSFEHTVGLFLLPSLGFEVVYGRGVEHLAADLVSIRPEVVAVVPRLLEAVRGRMLRQVQAGPAWRRRLFEAALQAGLRRLDGDESARDRLLAPLLDRLVRRRVRGRFGGRLVAAVSGAARLDPELARFFLALGVTVMQGYGQTEAGPVISVNPYGAIRPDTVGPPCDGVELRIATDGEVLVRGALVMDGYWRQPDATAAVLRDGWLHTGDVGILEQSGYLRLVDRKRDVIVLSGGEKVSPARVEGLLVAAPEIAQAVVGGDGRAGLLALLVPAEGAEPDAVAAALARVNASLSGIERVRRHALVDAFTVENGLLTPTQKVRRRLVLDRHAALLG